MLELERRLGLTSIIAISLGATLGAFFVIPPHRRAHRSEQGCVWDRRDLRLPAALSGRAGGDRRPVVPVHRARLWTDGGDDLRSRPMGVVAVQELLCAGRYHAVPRDARQLDATTAAAGFLAW